MKAHTGNFVEGVDLFDNKCVLSLSWITRLRFAVREVNLRLGFSRLALAKPKAWTRNNAFFSTLHTRR